jgi:hypothetical protein
MYDIIIKYIIRLVVYQQLRGKEKKCIKVSNINKTQLRIELIPTAIEAAIFIYQFSYLFPYLIKFPSSIWPLKTLTLNLLRLFL